MNVNTQVEGIYTLSVGKEGEKPRYESGPIKNLITNVGLDAIGGSGGIAYCHVGAGNTTPAFTDTALATFIASQGSTSSAASVNNVSGNYYGSKIVTYVFSKGAAAGNLAEIGVSSTAATGALFSRALILDTSGAATTLTVLADEVLTVTYELRWNYSELDVSGSIVISGSTYATVVRPFNVTNPYYWSTFIPGNFSTINSGSASLYYSNTGLIPITGTYSGNLFGIATQSAYVNGNYYIEWTYSLGPTVVNDSIAAIMWESAGGAWQMGFTPALVKGVPGTNGTKTLAFTVRFSWARV